MIRDIQDEIMRLKKENDVCILAHLYQNDAILEVADSTGDSFALAKLAQTVPNKTVLMCGVRFMGESAKILNPGKKVLLPDLHADCPMAHMAAIEKIEEVRKEYPDVAVVCYVNSTAELKSHSDVCVTSSNAVKIVKELPNHDIFFIPDEHLGTYVAEQVPEKHIILNDGFCHVHAAIRPEAAKAAKEARPQAKLLVHPECRSEVVALADYVGSTAGIIKYAEASKNTEFLVATELGVFAELKKRCPDKKFYAVGNTQICPNMKKVTLDKLIEALENEENEVLLSEQEISDAHAPLLRMLELAK